MKRKAKKNPNDQSGHLETNINSRKIIIISLKWFVKVVVSTRETMLSTAEILLRHFAYGIRSGFQYVGTGTNLYITVYGSRDCDARGF